MNSSLKVWDGHLLFLSTYCHLVRKLCLNVSTFWENSNKLSLYFHQESQSIRFNEVTAGTNRISDRSIHKRGTPGKYCRRILTTITIFTAKLGTREIWISKMSPCTLICLLWFLINRGRFSNLFLHVQTKYCRRILITITIFTANRLWDFIYSFFRGQTLPYAIFETTASAPDSAQGPIL